MGALCSNELYFQVRGVEGKEGCVYHYEATSSSLALLQGLRAIPINSRKPFLPVGHNVGLMRVLLLKGSLITLWMSCVNPY